MARVTFKENQPIQALSGTLGDITFRTMYGVTHMYRRAEAELPKNATRKQRAQYKQRMIIDQCVMLIQSQIEDMETALAMRSKIKDRFRYLYKQYAPEIKARTKLQIAMMRAYHERYDQENGTRMDRENQVTSPLKVRKSV